jgi:hypothetical protein
MNDHRRSVVGVVPAVTKFNNVASAIPANALLALSVTAVLATNTAWRAERSAVGLRHRVAAGRSATCCGVGRAEECTHTSSLPLVMVKLPAPARTGSLNTISVRLAAGNRSSVVHRGATRQSGAVVSDAGEGQFAGIAYCCSQAGAVWNTPLA